MCECVCVCVRLCQCVIDAIEKKTCIFFAYLLAYQVLSNHNEPQAIWFDNSELKSLPEPDERDDVILIDDDDDDGNSSSVDNSNSNSHEPSDNNSSSGEQKLHTCDICHSKLSSSYNLKRHHMIHTGGFFIHIHSRFFSLSSVRNQGNFC